MSPFDFFGQGLRDEKLGKLLHEETEIHVLSFTLQSVCNLQILLQKSFLADERNFSGPLMRSARGDVRDHIVLHKNDHGPSYRP
jgi:hypothetical protein